MSIIAASKSAKLLEIETLNLVHGFVWKLENASGCGLAYSVT